MKHERPTLTRGMEKQMRVKKEAQKLVHIFPHKVMIMISILELKDSYTGIWWYSSVESAYLQP